MRSIVLIAALAALAGCGGEAAVTKTKPKQKAPVTIADWRVDAHVACLRIQNAFNTRAYASDLRQLRKRLPGFAREMRAAAAEIRALESPPDAAGRRFVAALPPVETAVARLVEASRTMKTGRLTAATRRLAVAVAALAKAAQRSRLECMRGGGGSGEVSAIRAPIAAERLAAIERRVLARLEAVKDVPPPAGPQKAIAALEDEDAALRALDVPDWASDARAAYRRGCRGYREGLAELNDRYNAGQGITHEQWVALSKRPVAKCDRLMKRLWGAMRARPVHGN